MGKINFIHIFVPKFSQVIKPLQFLVKKDIPFKWSVESQNAFTEIRRAIVEALSLVSPYFGKDFIIYTFATDFSYAVVVTQKDHEDAKIPISFMSLTFTRDEINYYQVDK